MSKCRYCKIDPYRALYDRDKQQRKPHGVECEQQHYQHHQHRDHAYYDIISRKGLLKVIFGCHISDHIYVSVIVILPCYVLEIVYIRICQISSIRQIKINQHTIVFRSDQLKLGIAHLLRRIQYVLLLVLIQLYISLFDLVCRIYEHVNQRHRIF